ncbi:diphthine methyltransferase [Pogonomyrmex barbatus]|uniref:methylated diphthine methylhydrolase n=1 Tax=Pogonomyrmex barbatus TaxID=144034 RepID=A0A6I9W2C4_9HYME|nr:diphthine methyltransferase [Pogonomyrmex barbatus]XP_011635860.1 diphthine methyltransferase [Pogonomyrmex barbatus]
MADGEVRVRTLATFNTEYPADTIEWCPVEPFRNILACGTYKLDKSIQDTSSRAYKQGRIYLLRVIDGGKLELLQTLHTAAVLDMRWLQVVDSIESRTLLAVADSAGYLIIYQLNSEGSQPELKFITKSKVSDNENVMALSLDWSTEKYSTSNPLFSPHIIVSDTAGQVSHFTWRDTGDLMKNFTWPAHEFQAWIAAYDYDCSNLFYTGGDDSKFLGFDTRTKLSTPTFCKKDHTAGVTSIHNNVNKPFLLATGSYDHIMRLWDKRYFMQPISTVNLKGGIWRLKWDPFTRQYLLAACMYNGFKIVLNDMLLSVVAEYNEHQSIAYGCDWSFLKQQDVLNLNIPDGETLISTCSYEDCSLKISVVNFWPGKWDIEQYDSTYR